MNPNPTQAPSEPEALEARFGRRVGARLEAAAAELPHDITERLRFAREQALARQRLASEPRDAPLLLDTGPALGLGAGGDRAGRSWNWLTAALSLLGLLLGLLMIDQWQGRQEIIETAELDAGLLADDLPPDAYSDPGFAAFLRTKESEVR